MDDENDFQEDVVMLQLWLSILTAGVALAILQLPSRRWHVRPINKNARRIRGAYKKLFLKMKIIDPEQFFVYTRMTPCLFDKLLSIVAPFLRKSSHRAIRPGERLALTLKYLAHGGSMQNVVWEYGIGKSTGSMIIRETCNAIWSSLQPTYLKELKGNDWSTIADGFYDQWNLPNCLGAIDGKHVVIQCPKLGGSQFFNYKRQHSIILMATCDHNYKFTMVDIGGYGSQGDSTIFRTSNFGQQILDETLEVPEARNLPGTQTLCPLFFVGDEAFPLRKNIMRPYPGKFLNGTKRIFNYRLSRARRTIENAFGILVSRWRILRTSIIASTKTVDAIVKATVCLHNFIKSEEEGMPNHQRRYCPNNYADRIDDDGIVIDGIWRQENSGIREVGRLGANNPQVDANRIRETLAAYLTSPAGEVAWQYRHINGT